MIVRPTFLQPFIKAHPSLRKRYLIGSATTFFVVLVALQFMHTKATSPLDFLPSVILALSPVLLYVSVRWPLIFPYCAYVLILPFESLSLIGSAGTLAKFIAIACALALVAEIVLKKNWVRPPPALTAWVALLGWMFITDFWALDQSDAWNVLPTLVSLIALYVVIALKRPTKLEFDAVLATIVAAGVVSAGYAAVLYRSGGHDVLKSSSRVMLVVGEARIDPNAWAASLVLPVAITLYYLFNARSAVVRAAMLPAVATLFAGLAALGSRGGILSVLTVFALLCTRSRHRVRLVVTLVASALIALVANPGLIARFQAAQTDGAAGRADVWKIGLHALRNHWLFGAGVGNFPSAFDQEYLHVVTRSALTWHVSPHNVPLLIATELGLVGFVLWIGVLYYQMNVLSVIEKDRKLYELRLALEGAFLGGLVSSFSSANLGAKYIWLIYFTMLITRSYALLCQDQTLMHFSHARAKAMRRSAATTLTPS